ncbi:MAG: hypothetical protein R2932_41810 [Caldilineaceae bacterium]
MPWTQTLPRFAQTLSDNGYLALVEQHSPPDPGRTNSHRSSPNIR